MHSSEAARPRRQSSKFGQINLTLLPFSSSPHDRSARSRCRRAYVRTRAYATHARAKRTRVYTCTWMHVETCTRGSTCVLFRPCVYFEASESLVRSSQATRCTGSREKLHAALRECRRHVQGVPLRRVRRFARQERCCELASSLRSGRLSLPLRLILFFSLRRSLRGITDLPLGDDHAVLAVRGDFARDRRGSKTLFSNIYHVSNRESRVKRF